jgi:hypothetical protein
MCQIFSVASFISEARIVSVPNLSKISKVVADGIPNVNKGLRNANWFSSTVAQGAIVADYALKANDLGDKWNLGSAFPMGGIANSIFTLSQTALDVLLLIVKERKNGWSAEDYVEIFQVGLLAYLTFPLYTQLLDRSINDLTKGTTIAPFYDAYAFNCGLGFIVMLLGYLGAELAIYAKSKELGLTREELLQPSSYEAGDEEQQKEFSEIKKFFATRDAMFIGAIENAINYMGYSCLRLGYPVGFAFLAVTTLYNFHQMQKQFAPNLFNFSLFAPATKQDNKENVTVPTFMPGQG